MIQKERNHQENEYNRNEPKKITVNQQRDRGVAMQVGRKSDRCHEKVALQRGGNQQSQNLFMDQER